MKTRKKPYRPSKFHRDFCWYVCGIDVEAERDFWAQPPPPRANSLAKLPGDAPRPDSAKNDDTL